MKNIDPNYPLFVLVFLVIKKDDYNNLISPIIQKFKFDQFGHDQIIFHEREIRKDLGSFSFLKNQALKDNFLEKLNEIITLLPFELISVVIDIKSHKLKYIAPKNPYHLGLEFGLERVKALLINKSEWKNNPANFANDPLVHVIVEQRGKNEDNELELEFRRICDGANYENTKLNFEIVFADKKTNSAGLQIADLVARPIGMSKLKPDQNNRAMNIIKTKLVEKNGKIDGWGIKKFP